MSAHRPLIIPTMLGSPSSSTGSALAHMLSLGTISLDQWEQLSSDDQSSLSEAADFITLARRLLELQMATPFQADQIRQGRYNGLVLGNYRLLSPIGSGGMGTIYRAEHVKFLTPVAVKALILDGTKNRRAIERFFLEVRAVALLKHPNIVAAIDAGEEPGVGPEGRPVPYLVMEFIDGQDLDDRISRSGPLDSILAARLGHQIADALTESHRHGLIHRDIKPSNVLVTRDGKAKLLDFGVARLPSNEIRLTVEGARLGTVGYMAPEQARNPRDVDARADVFGLGATLFYALTGEDPFTGPNGSASANTPPSIDSYRSDIPRELTAVIGRMMALDPAYRTSSAAEAMRELAPFQEWNQRPIRVKTPPTTPLPAKRLPPVPSAEPIAQANTASMSSRSRVLIVDDEDAIRRVCQLALPADQIHCEEVNNGLLAVELATSGNFDLILLDMDLPGLHGAKVLERLRQTPPSVHLKIILMSGRTSGDDLSRLLAAGADDFITKPFSIVQLRSRVKAALLLKQAQDRSEVLSNTLAIANTELESALNARDSELVHARGALVLAMAKLVEQRSKETGPHLLRLQRYCRVLAEAAARQPSFTGRLNPVVVQAIETAAPLHDIGKVGVSDQVLNKPGRLTEDERLQMQAHTIYGATTLAEVAARYPFASGFFHTAIEIARSHHERWDGAGYPDGLSGESIPLSARLLAVADVYDAMRSPRVYKASQTHEAVVGYMLTKSPGHFDPAILDVFSAIHPRFEEIYREASE